MFISPVLQVGVQRAAALCWGRGVPEILFFLFRRQRRRKKREKWGTAPYLSQGALSLATPQKMFYELLKNSG